MSAVAPVVADAPPDVPEAASVGRIDDAFAEEEEEEEEEGKEPLVPGSEKSEKNDGLEWNRVPIHGRNHFQL